MLVSPVRFLESGPPDVWGGGATASVSLEDIEWNCAPERDEAGTPNVLGAVALATALEHLHQVGFDVLATHERGLESGVLDALAASPEIVAPARADGDRVGVFPFAVRGRDPHELAEALGARGVAIRAGKFCAHPLVRHLRASLGLEPEGGLLRVSLAGSTGMHEITRFATALGELLEMPAASILARPETTKDPDDHEQQHGRTAERADHGARPEELHRRRLGAAVGARSAAATWSTPPRARRSRPCRSRVPPTSTRRSRPRARPSPAGARRRRSSARACSSRCARSWSQDADRLARSVTTEMGKTLPDARAEVARAIEMVECACAIPTTMQGRNLEDVSRGIDCETYRQPIGVFAAIVPFNFPAMVPMWFLPFAIACGNTFILKPSEQVPQTQSFFFEIIEELGLPAGVVNLVNGARETVEALLDHPGIDGISFVGSATVAKLVYERAARAGKRVQALGGAKNHMVVMPDAVMGKTIDGIIGSAFGAAGQRCMAGSVLVTVGDAHDKVVPVLAEKARALSIGDGAADGVMVGPLVSCEQRDRVRDWIDRGERDGATVLVDGRDPSGVNRDGRVRRPDAADRRHARDGHRAAGGLRTRALGDPRRDARRRDRRREPSRYGNGTSIFTESGAAARRYRHDIEVGMIGVNIGVAAPVAFFPFSGWKDSFFGDLHAHGGDAVEFYTRKTTVTTRWYGGGETGRFFVE